MVTKKRYLAVICLLIGIVCLGTLIPAMLLPLRPDVTNANFDRIQIGMKRAEVEEILGKKPNMFFEVHAANGSLVAKTDVWRNPDGSETHVEFSDNLVRKKFWGVPTEPIIGKIRRWLHF